MASKLCYKGATNESERPLTTTVGNYTYSIEQYYNEVAALRLRRLVFPASRRGIAPVCLFLHFVYSSLVALFCLMGLIRSA